MKSILLLILFASTAHAQGGLMDSFTKSASGMKVQGARMKVIAQNIANAESTGTTPGAEPYRRKTITFTNKPDRNTGTTRVMVEKIGKDHRTPFAARYDPVHPAAGENGYVLYPNVKRSIEMMDMREAERSYEANLGALDTSKNMYQRTIDLLR